MLWCDIAFSWFGKIHAFFAVLFSKLFRKRSIVVSGGDDVANIPEIRYGMFSFWWKKWCPLFVFKNADSILAVSNCNLNETIENAGVDQRKVKMIYHGFDPEVWKMKSGINKEKLVITVGRITEETAVKKGLKIFVQSAGFLPDTRFILVGPAEGSGLDELKKIAPANVAFSGCLSGDDLIEMMSRAKVYVQASFHEAFGCSLAEAMLCECIPVVSKNAAIPEVVGDRGIYLDELTPKNVAEKIRYAVSLSDVYGKKGRDRIVEKFPLSKRKQEILEAISNAR
jgi:glycosyltransferase involved in cell wall biosynthesis